MARIKPPQRKLKFIRLILLVVAVLILCGAFVGLHYFQVRRQAGLLLVRADAHAEKKEWSEAAQLYKSYTKIRRDEPEVLSAYTKILEELQKTKPDVIFDQQKVYEELLALDPTLSEARRKLVRVYLIMQQFPAAEVHLKTLNSAKDANQDLDLQLLWSDWYQLTSKNYTVMADHLRKAIATKKAEPKVYGRLARLLKVDIRPSIPENEREAESVIAQLLQEKPQDIDARLVRADYRFYFHGPDAAREEVLYAYRNIPGGAGHADVAIALQRLAVTAEDYNLAREALTKAIQVHGNEPRLGLALADVLSRGTDPASAKKTLQEALEKAPLDIVLVEVSERLLAMGDAKTARIQADRLAKSPRMSHFVNYLRGRADLVEGNWSQAIEPLQKAVSGLNNHPQQRFQAHFALSECYRLGSKPELRRDELNQAEKLDPRSSSVRMALADTLIDLGQINPAIETYTAALTQTPDARAPLARLRLAQQVAKPEKERSWVDVEDLIGQEPLNGELAVIKANMLFVREKPEEAVKVLQTACTKPETGPAPRVALVSAVAIKDRKLADQMLTKFEQEMANSIEIRLARARFLLQEEKVDLAAIRKLKEKLEGMSVPERAKLLSNLGDLLAQTGYGKDAIPILREALTISPYDGQLHLMLFDLGLSTSDPSLRKEMQQGLVKLEGADGPRAIVTEVSEQMAQNPTDASRVADYRKRALIARKARPNWPRVHILLGDIERLGRQSDAAVEHYREAVRCGDQSDVLLRIMTPLLLERQSQQELLDLLAKRNRLAPLPADLGQQLALLRSIYAEDTEKSVAWAKSPQALSSNDYRDHLRRASIFIAGNAFPDARTALEKALSLNNAAPDAWLAMVQFLVLTERKDEALAARKTAETSMKSATNSATERGYIERVKGLCRELTGEIAGAEEAFKTATVVNPEEVASHDALLQHLVRQDRRTDASKNLNTLIQTANSLVVRRWARRALAGLKLSGIEAFAERNAAMQLIETNLAEGGNLVEDVRAKALILAMDPFQQQEAISLLLASIKSVPLSAEQSYQLARIYTSQGDLGKAEETLRASTRAVSVVAPQHLAMLCQIQVKRGERTESRQTVERLKTIAPKTWLAVSEEARVLALENKAEQGGKMLLEQFGKEPRAVLAGRIAPFLEQIGSHETAVKVFSELANEKGADSHVPYVGYLIRQGKFDDAWKLLAARLKDSSPGMSARLMGATARSRPLALLQAAEQTAWSKELQNAEAWIKAQLQANPDSVDLLLGQADLADALGRHDDAIAGYRKVLEKAPDQPVALNNLALLLALHTRDRSATALQLINQVISRRGPQPTFLDTRGIVHYVAERYTEASKDLEAAIRIDLKPVYQYHLAVVYDKQASDRPELLARRDNLLRQARSQNLTKQQLHPREWAEFDRLMAQLAKGSP